MYQFREARNDIQREIMDSAKEIKDSANEVRREVEGAAKLAENQAKKAQDTLNESLKIDPKSISFPTEPPQPKDQPNPES